MVEFKEGSIVAEHYELKRHLGQGSFGDVWLAHNLLADIDVAIKFYGTLDAKGLDDFRNEFKVAYKLRHPNLLNINHFDVFESYPYLVMPYCANGSVTQHIGKMPESEVWKFVLDVSGGLAFLHSQEPPIVHQDIKPDNILITSDGRYVISDFGISRSFRTKMSRTNNNVSTSGTIAYMGPERFSEKPLVVLASDIWAFGMTLYELITGDVLWEGMGGCVQLSGARIPTSISGCSLEMSNLVTSCLAAETWNRPTAVQIHEYASAYLQKRTIPPLPLQNNQPTEPVVKPAPVVKPTPVVNPAPSPVIRPVNSVSKPKPSPTPTKSQNNNLRNGLIIAAAVCVVIAILSGIIMYFNKQYDDQNSETLRRIEALKQKNASANASTDIQSALDATPNTSSNTTKEEIRVIDRPSNSKQPKNDDRIEFRTSKNTSTPVRSSYNSADDDAMFYGCVSVNDYETYLNSYPRGRHRSAAQNAINSLLGRNDNTANDLEPVNTTPTRRIDADPPVSSSVRIHTSPQPHRTSYSEPRRSTGSYGNRGGGGPRNGGSRSSGSSSHRHSN